MAASNRLDRLKNLSLLSISPLIQQKPSHKSVPEAVLPGRFSLFRDLSPPPLLSPFCYFSHFSMQDFPVVSRLFSPKVGLNILF